MQRAALVVEPDFGLLSHPLFRIMVWLTTDVIWMNGRRSPIGSSASGSPSGNGSSHARRAGGSPRWRRSTGAAAGAGSGTGPARRGSHARTSGMLLVTAREKVRVARELATRLTHARDALDAGTISYSAA